MHPEYKRGVDRPATTIEFCGTPYKARYKFLIHNAIEDMVAERVDEEITGYEGISHFYWPTRIDETTEAGYFEQMDKVRKLLGGRRNFGKFFLIQDGAFAALILTEVMKRTGVFSESDADQHQTGLLPYVKMEDLIILTLVRPRAALTRELYPRDLAGYDNLLRKMFIFYTVYNEAAEKVLCQLGNQLPPVKVIRPQGDDFLRDEIFFENANAALQFLKLPTIEEWSRVLEEEPERKVKGRALSSFTGHTVAGLTVEEIRAYLEEKDWSQNKEKRDRGALIQHEIVRVLTERGLIPDKE